MQALCQVNKLLLYQSFKIFFAFSATTTDRLMHHIGALISAWLHIGACLYALFDLQWPRRKKSEFKIMNDPLEQLTKRISSLIPGDVKHMQDDIEANIKSLLQSTLTRMNLVTREEFDVQSAVLQRTREKLEQLEKQLEELK